MVGRTSWSSAETSSWSTNWFRESAMLSVVSSETWWSVRPSLCSMRSWRPGGVACRRPDGSLESRIEHWLASCSSQEGEEQENQLAIVAICKLSDTKQYYHSPRRLVRHWLTDWHTWYSIAIFKILIYRILPPPFLLHVNAQPAELTLLSVLTRTKFSKPHWTLLQTPLTGDVMANAREEARLSLSLALSSQCRILQNFPWKLLSFLPPIHSQRFAHTSFCFSFN